ncbi:MAG: phosphohistidine phosphatase SixA [Phycisphaeraceae bacterium]|nr:phosphohistidine phosphatase SixA [Phycisphaeraceae bacterium]
MQLTLFRHGIAQPREASIPDADRQLTTKGIDRTIQAAKGLAVCCTDVQLILTSPKIRARQTADIASEILDVKVQISDVLAKDDLDAIAKTVGEFEEEHIMLVGHEPTFTELASYLCSEPARCKKACGQSSLVLKKAGALSLSLNRNSQRLRRPGQLLWLMQPSMLRKLGKS